MLFPKWGIEPHKNSLYSQEIIVAVTMVIDNPIRQDIRNNFSLRDNSVHHTIDHRESKINDDLSLHP